MTTDLPLVARLRAAIDERERVAQGALDVMGEPPMWPDYQTYTDDATRTAEQYLAQESPAAVPRRVAAARKILDLHGKFETYHDFRYCLTCGSGEPYEHPTAWPCETLLALAEGYGVTDVT